MSLDQTEAFARIRLLRSPNIGPVTYAQLLARFGNAVSALGALPDLGKRGGRSYRPAKRDQIEREVVAEAKDMPTTKVAITIKISDGRLFMA